jgi:integrase
VAIGRAHTLKAFPNPTKADIVRLTMRGIRRTHAVPQRRVAALTRAEILAMASSLGDSAKDLRDRAVLLVGFAGAFRRSELVAIDYKSLRLTPHGLVVMISRSKSDQEGHGREILVRYGRGATCPIRALESWLSGSSISEGPVFRSMQKGGQVGKKAPFAECRRRDCKAASESIRI